MWIIARIVEARTNGCCSVSKIGNRRSGRLDWSANIVDDGLEKRESMNSKTKSFISQDGDARRNSNEL
jgi:hypothetical protein